MTIAKMTVLDKSVDGHELKGSCRYCNRPGVNRYKDSDTNTQFDLCAVHEPKFDKVKDTVEYTLDELRKADETDAEVTKRLGL